MIHPDDVAAWLAQVRQNPEAAPGIIEALAARLIELDEQNESLRDELVRLTRNRAPVADEARVAALTRRLQALERQLTLPDGASRSLMIFTLDGRGARVPLPDVDAWRGRSDSSLVAGHLRPRHLLIAAEDDRLLFFTDKGRAVCLQVADVDLDEAPINYASLLPDLTLDLDESVSVVLPIPLNFDQLTLITRKGYARSFRRAEVDSLLERNLPLHSSPVTGDYPAFAVLSDGQGELLIVTRTGKGARFPERTVGVQSTLVIKLDRGDVVAGAAVVNDETAVVLIAADATATRREMAGFGTHATAGHRGRILTRFGDVVAAAPVGPEDVLWLLTAAGKLETVRAARVPSGPGASSGKAVVRLGEDRFVALAVSKGD